MNDDSVPGCSKSVFVPPDNSTDRGLRRLIQNVRRAFDDYIECYDATINAGTMSDKLHARDLRRILVSETEELRRNSSGPEPTAEVTVMLNRVAEALETRVDVVPSRESVTSVSRQRSTHATVANAVTLSGIGEGDVIPISVPILLPTTTPFTTCQSLPNLNQWNERTNETGAVSVSNVIDREGIHRSDSRESINSGVSHHSEVVRNKNLQERLLFEARERERELEETILAERRRFQRELEREKFNLRQQHETDIAELRDRYESARMPPPRTTITPVRSLLSATAQARTSEWIMNQPAITSVQPNNSNITQSTAHNTLANLHMNATQPAVQSFQATTTPVTPNSQPTAIFQPQLNPCSQTQSNILNLDSRNYAQQTLNSQPLTNMLGLTSSYTRPIAHTTLHGPVPQPIPQLPIQTWINPPISTPSVRSENHASEVINTPSINIASDAAAASLLQVQTESYAHQLLVQRRPRTKYTGDNKRVDFESFCHQCENLLKVPGVTDSLKLAELPYWFGGTAALVIDRYIGESDATLALADAFKALKAEFGRRKLTAKQLLNELLQGERFYERDNVKIKAYILEMEKILKIARETQRESSFNEPETINDVIRKKFPFLALKWAKIVAERENDHSRDLLSFAEFLTFLKKQNTISQTMGDILKTSEVQKPLLRPNLKVAAGRVEGTNYNRQSNETQNVTSPCVFCPGNITHRSSDCRKFASYTNDQKAKIIREKKLCTRCLETGHSPINCATTVGCRLCNELHHHSVLHGIPYRDLTSSSATGDPPNL